MLMVVTVVSALVHLFSIGYMKGDRLYSRFFAYLALFSFAMLGLVLSGNLLMLMICWEIMGLASYLLIGFWFHKKSAADAAKKAFLVTRVGDVGMLLGFFVLWSRFQTLDILQVFELAAREVEANGGHAPGWMIGAGLLIFLGPVGKSAQFPLHIWLPDAMEGPTPVSALIHAATMVAAGVYLIARLFPFYLFTPEVLLVIAILGAFTALIAATIGCTQWDIKKVLAYSTVSQLGFMMTALGCGALAAGTMHLMTHAWFKACLFLGSGSVIHGMHHHQDMREMGGLRRRMPVTYVTMLIATLAISGVPLLSGFYSKDAILAATLHPTPAYAALGHHAQGLLWAIPAVLLPIAAFLTAFYMFRMVFLTFHGEAKSGHAEKAHESPWTMTSGLVVLAVLSVFGASPWLFNLDLLGHHIWFDRLVVPMTYEAGRLALPEEAPEVAHGIAPLLISLLVAGGGILAAFLVYHWKRVPAERVAAAFGPLHRAAEAKYWIDEGVDRFVVRPLVYHWNVWMAVFDNVVIDGVVNGVGRAGRRVGAICGFVDKNVVDGSVNVLGFATQVFGAVARIFQTGFLTHYMTSLAVVVVIGLAMFGGAMQWVLIALLPVVFLGYVFLARRA
ncbi:MAG: NADH-quinone oxidoreductase subunit L [Planctomycetota bacterium]